MSIGKKTTEKKKLSIKYGLFKYRYCYRYYDNKGFPTKGKEFCYWDEEEMFYVEGEEEKNWNNILEKITRKRTKYRIVKKEIVVLSDLGY